MAGRRYWLGVFGRRHTYAAHVLLRCYRSNGNPQALLPVLARAMGHVSLASTAYCLPLLEPLLGQRIEQSEGDVSPRSI